MLTGAGDLGLKFFARVFLRAALTRCLPLVLDLLRGSVWDNLGLPEGDPSSSLMDTKGADPEHGASSPPELSTIFQPFIPTLFLPILFPLKHKTQVEKKISTLKHALTTLDLIHHKPNTNIHQ